MCRSSGAAGLEIRGPGGPGPARSHRTARVVVLSPVVPVAFSEGNTVGTEHQQSVKSSGASKGQIQQHFLALVVWHGTVFWVCLPFFSLTGSFSLV